MTRERLYLFDTTLRDGQQTQGVAFSVDEKYRIARMLDDLGIDYVEGGWPGANPTDDEFFASPPSLKRSTFTAFGMTRRSGRSAANDGVLAAVVNAGTKAVCLVGKAHVFHVKSALGISLEENLDAIGDSIALLVARGREAIFDCEHFFDGYLDDPDYAIRVARTAYDAGARWIVLCDTNGGTLPDSVKRATADVIEAGIPGDHVGIHCHNDTEHAIANTLAAVDVGARQIQGALNGLGERCGNANLISLIPTLLLKAPYNEVFETRIDRTQLRNLTRTSRLLDDILNRVPLKSAAYVGASAFAHKAGLHAHGVMKDPSTYEHVRPKLVGNQRVVPMSNQAGRSSLSKRLADAGLDIEKSDPRIDAILRDIKEREDKGYAYDSAQASFELVARRILDQLPRYFRVQRYRVNIDCRRDRQGRMKTVSEAVVVVMFGDSVVMNVSESQDEAGNDRGPVNALARALAKDLGPYQAAIDDMKLVDFKVRITDGGTEAVTRVIIDSEDGKGRRWSTVGVSPNIVDASFDALLDAINWKLIRDGVKPFAA